MAVEVRRLGAGRSGAGVAGHCDRGCCLRCTRKFDHGVSSQGEHHQSFHSCLRKDQVGGGRAVARLVTMKGGLDKPILRQ